MINEKCQNTLLRSIKEVLKHYRNEHRNYEKIDTLESYYRGKISSFETAINMIESAAFYTDIHNKLNNTAQRTNHEQN